LANEDSKTTSKTRHDQEDAEIRSRDPILQKIPPGERDGAWALWQKATRSLIENMFEDCDYWISRLRPGKRGLTPEECFHLWSYLGELRFHLWSKTLPKDEAAQISTRSENLQQELSETAHQTLPHASTSPTLVRLQTEIMKEIQQIQHHIQEAKQHLQQHLLAESWDHTEFDIYIQTPMDHIGYMQELLKAMKLSLSPKTLEALNVLEQDLRSIFHEAVHQYRERGDPINARRPVWPESFWWRHVGHVPLPRS
jgi:hypothetical protein